MGDRIPARPKDGSRHVIVPFNEIDEAFREAASTESPFSAELEVRAKGHIDRSRFIEAVSRAVRTHPMARARQAPLDPMRPAHRWEITDRLDVDPVQVVEHASDEGLARERDELHIREIPLNRSPVFRLKLVHHPKGDAVIMCASHAAGDGVSCLRLMRSILREYAGEPDPVPPISPLQARSLEAHFARPWSPEWIERMRAFQRVQIETLLAPPARVAPEGGTRRAGYGFYHATLSAERASRLQPKRFGPATVNDLLVAALHYAIAWWNFAHGAATDRIALMVPVNLRPRAWWSEIFANLSLSAMVTTRPRDRADPSTLLRSIAAQTQAIKRNMAASTMIDVLRSITAIPIPWRRSVPWLGAQMTSSPLTPTAVLSNLGRINEAYSFGADGPSSGVFISPPCPMPMGIGIGVLSQAGALHCSFRYRHPLMSAAAAQRFADTFFASLELLG
jgi:NRPS condensation-like uncharacterized protein